ncbi:MAG: phytoene/squalene synthase family protein [Pseudomonadota bacterium]
MAVSVVSDHSALAAHGARAIADGSKSFALASRLFGGQMRTDAQMLYAWCRHCDDIIDGQTLGADAPDASLSVAEQTERLARLREQTGRALRGATTGVSAFDGFALVAARHELPPQYAFDLLDGFAMDVDRRAYGSMQDTLAYCYGVAGAVGVMMAILMGVSRDDHATLDRACDLGLAFQLTNICRDVVDDARAGRVYLPADLLCRHGVDPTPAGVLDRQSRPALASATAEALREADRYYASAARGVRALPIRAAAAVLAARNIYRDIGRVILQRGPEAWDERAYASPLRKAQLAFYGLVVGAPQPLIMRDRTAPPREDLWRRPIPVA